MTDIDTLTATVASLKAALESHHYICSDEVATAVFLAHHLKKPV